MTCREYMIQLCEYRDEDAEVGRGPRCVLAAIGVPEDVPDADVESHVHALLVQIVNEAPMAIAKQRDGSWPRKGDLFWSCTPNRALCPDE